MGESLPSPPVFLQWCCDKTNPTYQTQVHAKTPRASFSAKTPLAPKVYSERAPERAMFLQPICIQASEDKLQPLPIFWNPTAMGHVFKLGAEVAGFLAVWPLPNLLLWAPPSRSCPKQKAGRKVKGLKGMQFPRLEGGCEGTVPARHRSSTALRVCMVDAQRRGPKGPKNRGEPGD